MARMKYLMAATAVALFGAWPLNVAAQLVDPHHQLGEAGAPTLPPKPPTTQPAMASKPGMMGGTDGQQGMMGETPMMNMMAMMQMMNGGDAPGMAMTGHVDGRISFLHTELKITAAQEGIWNIFAGTLRTNAQTLGAARGAMMGQMGPGTPQAQTLTQRLDTQERWLTARLDGTRAIKVAFSKLYNVLSQGQKKTAEELLAPHMGMGMMAAGMDEKKGL